MNDSRQSLIRVFQVQPDGTLDRGRIFVQLDETSEEGALDGMAVDVQGNVYSTGPGGIWIFSPSGQYLGKLPVPEAPSNLAWGDRDDKTLYITARHSLYCIRTQIGGEYGRNPRVTKEG